MRPEALSTPSAGPLSPTGGECMTLMVATNHRADGYTAASASRGSYLSLAPSSSSASLPLSRLPVC